MPNRKRTSNESDKPDFQTFVDKLENMILTGAFKPRERLVEANLSQMFNVSRYWVRDAFKILETKELVMVTPFKGVVVSELSEQEVEEIFVIRVALEQLAIKLTLKNITPEDIKTLRELTETIDAMRTKFNIPAMVELDTQFHDYIFQLSQNQSLRKMINDLRKRCHIIRYSGLVFSRHPGQNHRGTQTIRRFSRTRRQRKTATAGRTAHIPCQELLHSPAENRKRPAVIAPVSITRCRLPG